MSGALVVLGVGVLVFACVGVVAMPGALARLHYLSLASLGAVIVAAAVLVREGASLIGLKALLVAVLLVATSPVLAHATARVIHLRAERRR
jgi:multicomponent Na+:H+ antiporter subunit G